MKVKWKPVLIAGIWAEALLLLLRIPIAQYGVAETPFYIGIMLYLVPMFLGGLWVARKIESRYILHGIWVGIVANIVYFPMALILSLIIPEPTTETGTNSVLFIVLVFVVAILVKIFGSALGSYVGSKMNKSAQKETST